MKIFSAKQVREWDAYTIMHEPVSSINLMERAAEKCFIWLSKKFNSSDHFILFCGTGNNGGDGLALARKLYHAKKHVKIYILAGEKRSDDFIINLERLAAENIDNHFITKADEFPPIDEGCIVVDALFGTGLNRPLEGLPAQLIKYINQSGKTIISIDIPSGLLADKSSYGNTIITATHTLSFQLYKLAFLLPENGDYVGDIHLLNINLDQKFYTETAASFFVIDEELIQSIYKPRKNFTHKYDYGSALMYTGSKNMIGAAILSAKACLRSGAGLVTVYASGNTASVIHTAVPEVMTTQENNFEKTINKKNAIAIGPGLEAIDENIALLKQIITHFHQPLVIDATALGLLSQFPELLIQRKQNPAILTPHTGEFEKLFGKTTNDFERIELALQKASMLNCYIILKGHYTFIATPGGKGYFNINGNPGMATAGSGDVLTGMVTGLLAQGYTQEESCLLGVYLHGMAGDIAAEKLSAEALIASDIIGCFGEAFKKIRQ